VPVLVGEMPDPQYVGQLAADVGVKVIVTEHEPPPLATAAHPDVLAV
jgi:hypothetical protein